MKIAFLQLKRLPVLTESGQKLGRVFDLLIDIETQSILFLIVKKRFSPATFQISRRQIVKIDNEKIIVNDLLVEASGKASLKAALESPINSTAIENSRK